MRALFVALIGCMSMAACSLQSPTSEAHSNLLGMTQKQISSCLGAPTQKTTEGAKAAVAINRALLEEEGLA